MTVGPRLPPRPRRRPWIETLELLVRGLVVGVPSVVGTLLGELPGAVAGLALGAVANAVIDVIWSTPGERWQTEENRELAEKLAWMNSPQGDQVRRKRDITSQKRGGRYEL